MSQVHELVDAAIGVCIDVVKLATAFFYHTRQVTPPTNKIGVITLVHSSFHLTSEKVWTIDPILQFQLIERGSLATNVLVNK